MPATRCDCITHWAAIRTEVDEHTARFRFRLVVDVRDPGCLVHGEAQQAMK